MRTLILVVLGGIALYFAWPHFSGVDASSPATEDDSGDLTVPAKAGTLQSIAQLEAQVGDEPPEVEEGALELESGSNSGAGAQKRSSGVELDRATGSPSAEPDGGSDSIDEFDDLDLNALGDPLYEGSLIVHDPDGLQAYLNGRGKDLSRNRKKLLIAYLLVARGQYGQVPKYAEGLEVAKDVTEEERALLQGAFEGSVEGAREAVQRRHKNPLILGASMAFIERAATEAATGGKWAAASGLLSEILLAEIDAPWEAEGETLKRWASSLEDAQASHRWSPEGQWRSMEVIVEPGDTLVAIRKRVIEMRPTVNICTGLIERSNQLGRYLREDDVLRIPLDPVRTVIDLSARWLFYLHGNEVVIAWPIAIGRVGQETTPGRYKVGEKTPEPTWFPTGLDPVPYGDPENPLGTRWIALEGSNGLGIHGTWEPETIGSMASDGCIRLRNDQVEQLFEVIPRGSEVVVRP